MEYKLSIPRFGKYTNIIIDIFKESGFSVVTPPPITKRTIELGVKYAPSEVCFPLKSTLGTMIEVLEKGANAIGMVSTGGWCVLRCYWTVQKQILEDLGYKFEMIVLNPYIPFKTFKTLKKINPSLSILKILKALIRAFKKIRDVDLKEKEVNKNSPIKLAVLGEIYVICEDAVNMDMIKKLHSLGCYVDIWLGLWGNTTLFYKKFLKLPDVNMRAYRKLAKKYFPELVGGHANENLVRAVKYAKEKFDGIICLKPMFCNPEAIIETILEKISKDFDIPILQYSLDEFTQKTHFYNRIEAFVETIKLRKGTK